MRKLRKLLAVALVAVCGFNSGCILPIYDSRPDWRTRQQIFQSENLRHIPGIWERMWFNEMPDLMTPYRVHGGVI